MPSTIDRIAELLAGPLAVSRALDPEIRDQLLALEGSRELPCVRGRTVVPQGCGDTIVVGHPNHLGVFDVVGGDSTIVLTGAWSLLRQIPEGATIIAIDRPVSETVAAAALAQVRRLGKRLRQLRGVQLAIRPQSPILIALLPHSPATSLRALPGVTVLDGGFPEYPGGIRIELPVNTSRLDFTRYAANLERFIMEEA